MTDGDLGGRPARSPYARPPADAPTESHAALIESEPEEFPVAPPEPAAEFSTTTSGPRSVATGWPTDPDDARDSGVAVTGSAVPAAVGGGASGVRPRPVQVATARRGPRKARLVIKHIDPWTVMKLSFVVSVVMLAVCVVAVAIVYGVLGKMGVWTQINTLVNEVSPTTTSSALHSPVSAGRVVGVAAVIGAINVVLLTALSTLGAAIYNLISDLVGGIEVTLTDP
ncbi:MAG TPA: DUF3566 domain-containing protein [Acidothermaceae bacterium]|nr:DUF3566 domain-containing protein [Acidothermaceae bacterium]